MLQMTFVICIAILSNYFGGEVKFVLVAKVNKSLTRIFSEKISECFRINTNASKTWLKYRPDLTLGRYLSQVFDAFVFIRKHSDIFSENIRVKLLFTLATNTNLTSPPK